MGGGRYQARGAEGKEGGGRRLSRRREDWQARGSGSRYTHSPSHTKPVFVCVYYVVVPVVGWWW